VDYIKIEERTLLEVPGYDKLVEFGVLQKFAYPLEGNLGEIVVATTRIETMLGDTAIAVHPTDDRYKQFHGKYAVHPLNGRKIPVIYVMLSLLIQSSGQVL
jgi:valyl-tRNA synthetase